MRSRNEGISGRLAAKFPGRESAGRGPGGGRAAPRRDRVPFQGQARGDKFAMSAPWSALIIDDDPGIRQSLRLCLEASDARVQHFATLAGGLDALERSRFDVVFLDLWLGSVSGLEALPEILRRQPGIGIIVITAFASYETAVEAMRLGAVDYLPKPFTPEQVRSAARRVVEASILKRQVRELQGRLDEAEGELTFETISPSYATFLETLARAADSEAVVMLRGESGTGKTALARWIHRHSGRSQGPFVTVHCPLLSNDLMSSVLFGHCVGAFTGAVSDTVGKVEEAAGGSLFLDEIGDLTADAQTRLLRFLHDRSYERVGDPRERCADVRLITATNRALETDVQAGRFREDLLFRLKPHPIEKCAGESVGQRFGILAFGRGGHGRSHVRAKCPVGFGQHPASCCDGPGAGTARRVSPTGLREILSRRASSATST